MTQAEVAQALGISQTYLSDLELGRGGFSLDLAMRIARLLGATVDDWQALIAREAA